MSLHRYSERMAPRRPLRTAISYGDDQKRLTGTLKYCPDVEVVRAIGVYANGKNSQC